MMNQEDIDKIWMAKAIEQAKLGLGRTRPNPPVGCVVVRDNTMLSSGFHAFAGAPHAEADALSKEDVGYFKDATLYVTLEPCCTTGRTPPCTEAIIKHKIKRVVISTLDINPKHSGKAIEIFNKHNIEVTTGVLEDEAKELLQPFFKWITTKKPFVTLKMAQSLDGAIADHAGNSKWITSVESRNEVKRIREKVDAVLVGCNTALLDNPTLLRYSPSDNKQCYRIIIDSKGRLPLDLNIFQDGFANKTIIVTEINTDKAYIDKVKATGASVWCLNSYGTSSNRMINLNELLTKAGEENIMHILCEGGASLASSMVNEGLVDELLLFIAPIILGKSCKNTFSLHSFDLPTAPRFKILDTKHFNCDIMLKLKPDGNRIFWN